MKRYTKLGSIHRIGTIYTELTGKLKLKLNWKEVNLFKVAYSPSEKVCITSLDKF